MEKALLQIINLTIGYQGIPLLPKLNFSCNEGEITMLKGPNGTGKTCLFQSLVAFIPCLNGEIFFENKNITTSTLLQRRKKGISLCPEGRMIFPNLTVSENLVTGQAVKGLFYRNTKQKMDEMYALFPKLYERRNQSGGTLSGGEQQMLALARSIIIKPKLLLLDEPLLGLSRLIMDDILTIITDVSKTGVSILLTDQNEEVIKDISHRVILLNKN